MFYVISLWYRNSNTNKYSKTKIMKTGLQVTPTTKEDARVINEAIANSDFYTEYNSEFGFYFFPEEEENYDELEAQIDRLFGGLNVNYRIEGVF